MKAKAGRTGTAVAAAAVAAALAAAVALPAQARPLDHDGKFLSKESNGAKSFRIKDDETGRKLRFRVNRSTQFERIPGGFSGMERGMVISVDGHTSGSRWIADHVERDRRND
jgi:hypothetical protein